MQQPLVKISKSNLPNINGEIEIISLTRDTDKTNVLSCKTNYIAILPFEKTADDTIKSIYGLKFENHATGQTDTTLLIDSVDPSKDQTPIDTIYRSLLEEAGLNIEELGITEDDIFYLGNISTSTPISSKFKCYAIDLTNISKPDSQFNFTRTLAKSPFNKDSSEIVKLGFHQVVNGDFSDSTILSGAFLLVSYFNWN